MTLSQKLSGLHTFKTKVDPIYRCKSSKDSGYFHLQTCVRVCLGCEVAWRNQTEYSRILFTTL